METSSFLSSWVFSPFTEKKTPKTPQKRTIPAIRREISTKSTNFVPQKRTFDFEFEEIENTPSKIRKQTKRVPKITNGVFKAGKNDQKVISLIDVQQSISEAIRPLILEIQSLKSEILSLKNERNPLEFSQNTSSQSESETAKLSSSESKSTQIAQKAIQKTAQQTAKKTFAEIAKLNSLVSEQSIKLDKWTLVERKSSTKKTELAPKKGLNSVDRRVLFTRENSIKSTKSVNISDLLLAINLAIKRCGLPEHIRLLRLWETPSGAISGLLKEKASAEMLISAKEEILKAAKKLDSSISSFQAAEQWYSLRIHTVSLERYLNSTGMKILKEEIKSTNGLNLPNSPRWINQKRAEERFNNNEIAFSTIVIKVRSKIIADGLIAKGIEFGGKRHTIELFQEMKQDTICQKCSKYGHNSYNACQNDLKCNFCEGDHETKDHKCTLKGCTTLTGKICTHTLIKCINCNGTSHFANSSYCPKRLEILEKMRNDKKKESLKLQESRKKIAVIIPCKSSQISENYRENEIEMHSPSDQLC